MPRKAIFLILLAFVVNSNAYTQEAFTIQNYHIDVKVNKDASLDVTEVIKLHFTDLRHGIIRKIPYKYQLQSLPAGVAKANRQLESGNFTRTIIENVKVSGWNYEVSKEENYVSIKIGSKDNYIDGNQQYLISYKVLNAINFFSDHSELYFNLIGDQWATSIDSTSFRVELYDALPDTSGYFAATGATGSKENKTITKWETNKLLSGHTYQQLHPHEGLTIGIVFPKDFLQQQNYRMRGSYWLILPFMVFTIMFNIWKKWGKDDEITVQTEFYPPENVSPSVSGYVIDGKLDKRDLTALIPYWGAAGCIKINEIQKSSLLGLIKTKDYEFVKLKELPQAALVFENTLFNGIFKTGDSVKLSDLKDVLYSTMSQAKSDLEKEIDTSDFYVKNSRGRGALISVLGVILFFFGIVQLFADLQEKLWMGIALMASAIIIFVFGLVMGKKTKKGTELYQKLLGFKEFLKTVEQDRLKEFLKQDENYFDKILPYAIVFDIAHTWKDKLKGLDVPPPSWYSGNYSTGNFNTAMFMSNLDHSMNAMSTSFYSSPSSSGSSGGSFGGGGSSGGGFGGGGGSSW
ncbi:MAG TPA: DUF2207 domain-containing protein [Hanamia sp.]|nr:DUF2207 domain-containing protein [Hanamia sp.]